MRKGVRPHATMKDRTWTGDDEASAFDDILSARVPSRGALRYMYMTILAAAGNMLEHTPCILVAACCLSLLLCSSSQTLTICVTSSNVLEDYELKALQSEHAAEQYAVRHDTNRRSDQGWRDPKQKIQSSMQDTMHHVQDALNVFKERGVLHHTEYDANVPAAVHGAPKTAEVQHPVALPSCSANGPLLTPKLVP